MCFYLLCHIRETLLGKLSMLIKLLSGLLCERSGLQEWQPGLDTHGTS